jgi:A/G-specific adenine glycosylase
MFTFQGAKYINLYSLFDLKNALIISLNILNLILLNKISNNFSKKLINWYSVNKRSLPWRNTKDSYKIWLSEIILQQTQVKQGLPYYKKFIKLYPNVISLSKTSEQDVLKNWEGLGYYSRARNLHKASKIVVEKYNSIFPNSYNDLIKLPGIGDYSASAISSFSNGELHPVVDGNVYRFISRLFGISTIINTSIALKEFKTLLNKLISVNNPGDFNQAIMEFGALVCKPKAPDCNNCIYNKVCFSLKNHSVFDFPVKKKSSKPKTRFLNYFLILDKSKKIMIEKRVKKDIWQNLFQFPLIETDKNFNKSLIQDYLKSNNLPFLETTGLKLVETVSHKLSHQNLKINFWINHVEKLNDSSVYVEELSNFPFPKPLSSFIETFNKFLK